MLVVQTASDRILRDERTVITDDEIAFFNRNNFVFPKVGLPEEDAAFMREAVEQAFRDNPNWAGIVRMPHVPRRPGQLEGIIGGEALFRLALHPTIIGAARRLIGPNLIMWGGEIFAKPAGTGKRTPWHQDCYNPAVKAGPGRRLPRSAQLWIAVDDVDSSNGSLQFVPRSGKNGPLKHLQFSQTGDLLNFELRSDEVDFNQAVSSVLKSGQYSVHDLFVVHGASANVSGRRRAGLTFHYMAAEDLYDRSFGDAIGSGRDTPAPLARRPIWLVLGENKCDGNDFVTGHQNLEDLDELAESVRRQLTRLLT